MECKSFPFIFLDTETLELIETLWNVNQTGTTVLLQQEWELIETLWNVNSERQVVIRSPQQELIETLWNVNTTYDVEDRETT